jgi:hypothetical protein
LLTSRNSWSSSSESRTWLIRCRVRGGWNCSH